MLINTIILYMYMAHIEKSHSEWLFLEERGKICKYFFPS